MELSQHNLLKDLPLDMVRGEILSALSVPDILRMLALLNTKSAIALDERGELSLSLLIELFSRHSSADDVDSQVEYLKHGDMAVFKKFLSNNALTRTLKASMRSRFSTLEHKQQILKMWQEEITETFQIKSYHAALWMGQALIRYVSFFLLRIRIAWIFYQWRIGNADTQLSLLKSINFSSPELSTTAMLLFIPLLLAALDNNNARIQQVALSGIEILLPRLLNPEDVERFVEPLLASLDRADVLTQQATLSVITLLLPRLIKPEHIERFIEPLFAKLTHKDAPIQQAALSALSVLLPKLNRPGDTTQFIDALLAKFYSRDWLGFWGALTVIKNFFPKQKKQEEVQTLIDPLLAKLNDGQGFVRKAALYAIAALIPELVNTGIPRADALLAKQHAYSELAASAAITDLTGSEGILQFIEPLLFFRLNNEHILVCDSALSLMISLLLKQTQPDNIPLFINRLSSKLTDENALVRDAALSVLAVLLPQLTDEKNVTSIIDLLVAALFNGNWSIRQQALAKISALLPKLTPAHLQLFINPILTKLRSVGSSVRQAALSVITALLPRLTNPEDAQLFIIPLLENVGVDHWCVRQKALSAITALLPRLANPDDVQLFVNPLLENTGDAQCSVRKEALSAITVLFLRLNKPADIRLFGGLFGGLIDEEASVCLAALRAIPALLSSVSNQQHLTAIYRALFFSIRHQNSLIYCAALNAIAMIISKIERHSMPDLYNPLLSRMTYMDAQDLCVPNLLSFLIANNKIEPISFKQFLDESDNSENIGHLKTFFAQWQQMNTSIPKAKFQTIIRGYASQSYLNHAYFRWFGYRHQSGVMAELNALGQSGQIYVSKQQIENILQKDAHKTRRLGFFQAIVSHETRFNSGTDKVIATLNEAFR